MDYETHVEFELERARKMTAKDHKQRWVTMDGVIHDTPQPRRHRIYVFWMPLVGRHGTVGYQHGEPVSGCQQSYL